MTRLAGVSGPIRLDEAGAIAEMMVATGRAVPAAKWVDSLYQRSIIDRSKALPHHSL